MISPLSRSHRELIENTTTRYQCRDLLPPLACSRRTEALKHVSGPRT